MNRLLRTAGVVLTSLVVLVTAAPVVATHSLPSPEEYWDCNSDNLPDDTCAIVRRAGAVWSVDAATRLAASDAAWRNATDFDITESTTSGQPVYRDRLASCLSTWEPQPGLVILAVVCVQHQWRAAGFYRITATPTFFNNQLANVGLSWYYGGGAPPNPATQIHFGGTAVHELGHWILLEDLDCQPGPTMCHSNTNGTDVFNAYSLAQDDIDAANAVY